MDISKLTAEQKAMILKAGKDGFDAKELRELGLNKQIAEELYTQLAGEAEEVDPVAWLSGDKDAFRAGWEKANAEAKARKQEYKENARSAFKEGNYGQWIKDSYNYAVAPNGAYQAAKSPLLGLLPFAAALIATSCVKDDYMLYNPNDIDKLPVENDSNDNEKGMTVIINVDVNININVSQNMDLATFEAIFNSIIQALNDIKGQLVNMEKSILASLEATGLSLTEIKLLLEQLKEQGNTNADNIAGILERIEGKLNELRAAYDKANAECNGKLDAIIVALEDTNYTLKDIVTILKEQGKTNAEILAALKENNKDIKEILKAMSLLYDLEREQNSVVSEKLDAIVKLLEKGVVLDQQTQDLVFKVLDAMNNLKFEGGTFDTANIEKALAAILDVISNLPTKDDVAEMNKEAAGALNNLYNLVAKFMEQDKAMDEATQKQIADLSGLIAKFMAQEEKMDAEKVALVKQVLEKIENLKFDSGDVTVNVDLSNLEAMMSILIDKVGNLEGGVQKLIELALAGNANIADLMKVVQAFKDESHADLEDVKALLKTIKDGVDKNGNTLLSIEEKLDIVNLTLKELKEQFPDLSAKLDEVIAKLGEILAKIPEGCDCNIDEILVKLELIIIELQKNPSNEGIIDDLDELDDLLK